VTHSQLHPQEEPSDHCYLIVQDHGPDDGGWGPAAIAIPGLVEPAPMVYTGSDPSTLAAFKEIARQLPELTGKPTRFVRYERRVDVAVYGGEGEGA
jgi:hypothetical protein